jgi:hypothetical protein
MKALFDQEKPDDFKPPPSLNLAVRSGLDLRNPTSRSGCVSPLPRPRTTIVVAATYLESSNNSHRCHPPEPESPASQTLKMLSLQAIQTLMALSTPTRSMLNERINPLLQQFFGFNHPPTSYLDPSSTVSGILF